MLLLWPYSDVATMSCDVTTMLLCFSFICNVLEMSRHCSNVVDDECQCLDIVVEMSRHWFIKFQP